jgi:(p)ppGpp synthase/HD superfamily hydrolase
MAQPQRVWLDNHLECVKTSRARAKIEEWFHARDSQTNLAGGQELLAATIDRLGIVKPDQAELAQLALRLGFDGVGALLVALGAGDCQILDVLDGLYSAGAVPAQMSLLPGSALPSGIYNINVRAQDRDGLLLDISTFLSKRGVQLLSNTGVVDPATQQASIAFSARLSGIHELVQVIDGLRQIPRVIDVRRIENRRRLD